MRTYVRLLMFILLAAIGCSQSRAISFSLDSISSWGKFPRFCVNTYRWGDKFFNSYDSTYVAGTGTKFNVKLTKDSWLNAHYLNLGENQRMDMRSDPSTSVGLYLTYLAVSIGYDVNISKVFGSREHARTRFHYGFNSARFSCEFFTESNKSGNTIKRIGSQKDLDIPFSGVNIDSWGMDAYYFFNNKRYSQAAAFNFSKIQRRSQGSFCVGLSVYSMKYDFDFSQLSPEMSQFLPLNWENAHYQVKTTNYSLRVGYGYNWVVGRNWVVCGSLSSTFGIRRGFVNSNRSKFDFGGYKHVQASAVWNHRRWFLGAVLQADIALFSDHNSNLMSANLSVSTSIGYRFNLW